MKVPMVIYPDAAGLLIGVEIGVTANWLALVQAVMFAMPSIWVCYVPFSQLTALPGLQQVRRAESQSRAARRDGVVLALTLDECAQAWQGR